MEILNYSFGLGNWKSLTKKLVTSVQKLKVSPSHTHKHCSDLSLAHKIRLTRPRNLGTLATVGRWCLSSPGKEEAGGGVMPASPCHLREGKRRSPGHYEGWLCPFPSSFCTSWCPNDFSLFLPFLTEAWFKYDPGKTKSAHVQNS